MATPATVVDAVLEGLVVPSFSRIGPAVRSRLFDWRPQRELPRLDGAVVLVTGATSGLGQATATALAARGATTRFLARDEDKARRVCAEIRPGSRNDDVDFGIADLGDLASVTRFADAFADEHDRLDVLVHNAGAMASDFQTTDDGLELTVQTNVVAPYLLSVRLRPLLAATPASRIVWVTSGGMYTAKLDVSDLEMTADDFDGATAYSRAKRAQVALTHVMAADWAGDDIAVQAMHPGWVDTPGLAASLPRFRTALKPLLRSAEQGADTTVWLASADEARRDPGRLWLDRRPRGEHRVPWTRRDDEADEERRLVAWCDEQIESAGV